MAEIVEPTDEQVMQAMSGEQGAPAPEQAQATENATGQPTEQTAGSGAKPDAGQPNVSDLITKALEEHLNPLRSELGQFRKMRSEWQKAQSAKPSPSVPQSWQSLTPEQQTAMQEMIDHAWQSKYGEQWSAISRQHEQAQHMQQLYSTHNAAQQYAGQDWANVDPIMGQMFVELKQKASQGDEDAANLVEEIQTTQTGVRWLVDQARQRYSQTVKSQADQTAAKQAEDRKKAATALGATNSAPVSADAELKQIMAIRDPQKRFEEARKYWLQRGEVQ